MEQHRGRRVNEKWNAYLIVTNDEETRDREGNGEMMLMELSDVDEEVVGRQAKKCPCSLGPVKCFGLLDQEHGKKYKCGWREQRKKR